MTETIAPCPLKALIAKFIADREAQGKPLGIYVEEPGKEYRNRSAEEKAKAKKYFSSRPRQKKTMIDSAPINKLRQKAIPVHIACIDDDDSYNPSSDDELAVKAMIDSREAMHKSKSPGSDYDSGGYDREGSISEELAFIDSRGAMHMSETPGFDYDSGYHSEGSVSDELEFIDDDDRKVAASPESNNSVETTLVNVGSASGSDDDRAKGDSGDSCSIPQAKGKIKRTRPKDNKSILRPVKLFKEVTTQMKKITLDQEPERHGDDEHTNPWLGMVRSEQQQRGTCQFSKD